MAQQVTVMLVDDIDGTEAEETVNFALDGAAYEIDLSAENAAALRDALEDFVESAQRLGRTRRNGAARSVKAGQPAKVDREQNQAIREWARKRGLAVSDRGRISAEVMEAYNKAH